MIEHHSPSSLCTYSILIEGGVNFLTNKNDCFLKQSKHFCPYISDSVTEKIPPTKQNDSLTKIIISEVSCDIKDWSNGCWKFSFAITRINYI